MRIDPVYSSFVNWSQLFVLGIIPVCLLVYFNAKIYSDIRERERRRRPVSQRALASTLREQMGQQAQQGQQAGQQQQEEEGSGEGIRQDLLQVQSGGQLSDRSRPSSAQGNNNGPAAIEADEVSYALRIKDACKRTGKKTFSMLKPSR